MATRRRLGRRPIAIAILAFALTTGARAQLAPVTNSHALPRSTPERQGISSAAILDFIDTADSTIDAMHSVMLVRHGNVVAEGWWAPYDAKTPHIFYSLSKSFTSTAVGLAIAEGKLSLDDEVLKFFPSEAPPEPSANLRAMRVRDLLRMATGNQTEAPLWAWSPDTAPPNATWVRTFLAHPVPFKPGTHFLYNSPATFMASAIVQKVTGMSVLDYLRPRIFEPLGYENPIWAASPEGISIGAFGLSGRTEDIAKFGQLYLQRGTWNGRQLIPAAWVDEATSRQTANGSSPSSDWDQGYGYQFWRSRHHSYRGDGAFGQYMIVIPDFDAVVAITSGVGDMQAVMNLVWTKLLPAMTAAGLPENTAAHRALQSKLGRLTMRFPTTAPNATLAKRFSNAWYEFPANDRGIAAVALDMSSAAPVLLVRTPAGETRTPIGVRSWATSRGVFANGLEKFLAVPANALVSASGAVTANDVFTVKLALPETPFYSTMTLRFDGDRLLLDTQHNVAFGPTKMPQLVGVAKPGR